MTKPTYKDNETVDGVEFPGFPKFLDKGDDISSLVVADMSSNFLSRKVYVSKHAVIFVSNFSSKVIENAFILK